MKKYEHILKPKPHFLENKIKFEAKTHSYFVGERKILYSASQLNLYTKHLYKKLENKLGADILQKARLKGLTAHKYVEYWFSGEKIAFAPETPQAVLKLCERLDEFLEKFTKDRILLLNEVPLISAEEPDLVGTPDLVFYNKITDEIELIDLKTTDYNFVNKPLFYLIYRQQIDGYEHLLNSNFYLFKVLKRYIIFSGGKNIILKNL